MNSSCQINLTAKLKSFIDFKIQISQNTMALKPLFLYSSKYTYDTRVKNIKNLKLKKHTSSLIKTKKQEQSC